MYFFQFTRKDKNFIIKVFISQKLRENMRHYVVFSISQKNMTLHYLGFSNSEKHTRFIRFVGFSKFLCIPNFQIEVDVEYRTKGLFLAIF